MLVENNELLNGLIEKSRLSNMIFQSQDVLHKEHAGISNEILGKHTELLDRILEG